MCIRDRFCFILSTSLREPLRRAVVRVWRAFAGSAKFEVFRFHTAFAFDAADGDVSAVRRGGEEMPSRRKGGGRHGADQEGAPVSAYFSDSFQKRQGKPLRQQRSIVGAENICVAGGV